MRLALQRPRNMRHVKTFYRESEPFVANSRGILIHRPRVAKTFRISADRPAHIAVEYWCGGSACGTKNITFLSEPPEDQLVCANCEERATKVGLQSSSELAGRHVCIGKLKAINTCCGK